MLVTRLLLVVAVGSGLIACSSGGGTKSKASPPAPPRGVEAGSTSANGRRFNGSAAWDVCGQSIGLTSAGFHVDDASDHDVRVSETSPPDAVYLLLSHDCDADVHYKVEPPDAAAVLATAPPAKPVAVVLHPLAEAFSVTFQRPSGVGTVTVDLAPPTSTHG